MWMPLDMSVPSGAPPWAWVGAPRAAGILAATRPPADPTLQTGSTWWTLPGGAPDAPTASAPDMRVATAPRSRDPRIDGPDARPPGSVMHHLVQHPPAFASPDTKLPPAWVKIPVPTTQPVGTVLDPSAARYAHLELRRKLPSTAHVSRGRLRRGTADQRCSRGSDPGPRALDESGGRRRGVSRLHALCGRRLRGSDRRRDASQRRRYGECGRETCRPHPGP